MQVGSRFVASIEASSHVAFKNAVITSSEGDTQLSLKQLTPVRLLKNEFYRQVQAAEISGASKEILSELLGKGRSRKGMFEGNLHEGELEIGQVSSMIKNILPASEILRNIWNEFVESTGRLSSLHQQIITS